MNKRARLVLALAGAPFAIGALVLLGWALGSHALISVVPGHVSVKANTAIAITLGAAALSILRHVEASSGRRDIVRVLCAVLIVMLGGATLLEYALGRDFGIDQLIFREPSLTRGTSHPGRMAPNSAVNFVVFGIALLALRRQRSESAVRVAQALVFLMLFVTLLALLGYVYRAQVHVGLFSLNRMALPTIAAFVSLGAGVLVSTSNEGWLGDLLRTRGSRVVAARLFPAAVIVPVAIGAVVLAGYRAGLYDAAFAACLMAGAEVVSFSLLTWLSIRALNAFEIEKTLARLDALTGLRSRRGFVIEARAALDACRRAGTGALVVYLDLDGMKHVNDTQGHHVGDLALTELASILRTVMRESDVLARLGGDEFVAFCAGADAASGADIVLRLSAKLDALNAREGRRYRLACSAGTAATDAGKGDTLDELLMSADAAMYRVKRARAASRQGTRSSVAPLGSRKSLRAAPPVALGLDA
jgi:diguanylate cyclase (GGDEF)-like protein